MSSDPHDPRYAPPQARVEDIEAPAQGLQLAGRSRRFWAAMIDFGVLIAGSLLIRAFTPFDPWDASAAYWAFHPANAVVGFALFLAINGWLLVQRGQTVGKALLKIRIARPDGAAASAGRVLGLRYGLGYVTVAFPLVGELYGLIDCLLIFRSSRRCLHDDIAGTIVVRA